MPRKDNRPANTKRYFNEKAKDIRKTWTGIKILLIFKEQQKPTSMLIGKGI